MPLDEISGHVYVLHYDELQFVRSVGGEYAGPAPRSDADGWMSATSIGHYVGWIQQRLRRKRINRHGPAALREIVYLQPGTMRDEQMMKASGTCASVARPLRHHWQKTLHAQSPAQPAICTDRSVVPASDR